MNALTQAAIDWDLHPGIVRRTLEWLGWDRIVPATADPHWDFDDPRTAFKCELSDHERHAIFRGNAEQFYRLG
jgi:predicted TIM-barrel fold metal-dependent hydrolase